MRILIVDDSETSCLLLKAILRNAGYADVRVALSAYEAISLLSEALSGSMTWMPQCILMDVSMPGMNGIEAVRAIKADPGLADIPVIIVTASDDDDTLEEAFEAGAVDYLVKPVSRPSLKARVNSALRLKQEREMRKAREKELLKLTQRLSKANTLLGELNERLEERVRERTEELQAAYDELKTLDDLKTAFLSNVSHELRTPLTSILGYASVVRAKLKKNVFPRLDLSEAKMGEAVARAEANLDIIIAEGNRLTERINDLIDFAMMESGEMQWRKEPVDFRLLAEKAASDYSDAVQEKGLRFTVEIAEKLPMALGDATRLLQALHCLLSNAVKFTQTGEVRLLVRQVGQDILTTVQDTGCGFPLSDYASVFEKFRQIESSREGKPKGVGLGLPICTQVVEHHGGRIWAESAPGVGSAFHLAIPAG